MTTENTDRARLSELSRSIGGKVAIVTGAASGMGRATAHLLADEGARVVVSDLGGSAEHDARIAAVVAEIAAVHGDDAALAVACDVADPTQLRALVEQALAWGGGIDIVVNNAGVSLPNDTSQPEDDFDAAWNRTLDVNLAAHARLAHLVVPHLLERGDGRIVNIASTEAILTQAGLISYAASKAGVVGLTKSLAVELGSRGITVNCICPGPIDTGMTAAIPEDKKATYARRRVPLNRYGRPEEVAQMTLNLCLPASSFVNGAVIPVDGGMSIKH